MKRAEKRTHLINVAERLFNQHGYHNVGIDLILAEADIAKTTLYRHFPSKDDLILEVLKRVDAKFRNEMQTYVDGLFIKPEEKLLGTFDFMETWFSKNEFFGCPFMSAASEYNDASHPIFKESQRHKELIILYFTTLARDAGMPQPEDIAQQMNILHEGAIAVAQMSGVPCSAATSKKMARILLSNEMQ